MSKRPQSQVLPMALAYGPALLVVAGLALTGCVDGAVFATPSYQPSYLLGEEGVGTRMDVDVRHDPFPIPPSTLAQDVADAMKGWDTHGPASFRPVAGSTAAYRVVFDFDGNGIGVCARPAKTAPEAAPVAQPAARVPAAAVLCRGSQMLSYLHGSVAAHDGPQSSSFRRSIGEMTAALMPVPQDTGHPGRAGS
jgi:hypothetical protein